MNKKCHYCDYEGVCVLENRLCTSEDGVCNMDITSKKVTPNSRDKFVVYFYDNKGEYKYCIECWCNTITEILDLIDDEHNDYTYEIRKVEN